MKSAANSFLVAVQFMTRLPVPGGTAYSADALAKSAVFFPLIGLLVGAGGAIVSSVLAPYASRQVIVVLLLVYLVEITGGLHEDALADAADGFGGGWTKERILGIMRDSRIGSFGAMAIVLGLLARFVFLTNLTAARFTGFFIAGQVLGRWTALPLACFLPSAREAEPGQGRLIAGRISDGALVAGTILAAAIVAALLKAAALWALLSAAAVVLLSGAYYRQKIGGITGDCLGATNQLAEIAVYLTGVLLR